MSDYKHPFEAELAPSILRKPVESVKSIELTATHTCFLEQLSSKPIDQAWLNKANELIVVGSEHLSNSSQDRDTTLNARMQLFDEHMGWDEPGSPYQYAYVIFKKS